MCVLVEALFISDTGVCCRFFFLCIYLFIFFCSVLMCVFLHVLYCDIGLTNYWCMLRHLSYSIQTAEPIVLQSCWAGMQNLKKRMARSDIENILYPAPVASTQAPASLTTVQINVTSWPQNLQRNFIELNYLHLRHKMTRSYFACCGIGVPIILSSTLYRLSILCPSHFIHVSI